MQLTHDDACQGPTPVCNWAPIVGRWSFDGGKAVYVGPQEGTAHPYGICVTNVRLGDGTATVKVTLSKKTSGRLLFGYRSPQERYLSAGLAGYRHAYTVTDFEPTSGWRGVALAGTEENLVHEREYKLLSRIAGQRVYLEVDDIRVLDHVLERPLPAGQVGLFAWGEGKVTFSAMTIAKVPARVFVVMQFSDPYQQLYTDVIQPACKEFGLRAYHVGDVPGPGVILHDIAQGLVEAEIVIAEITPINQNVFYELGYAHALGKPTILLAEKGKQLPFDVSGYRCLFYENSIGGKRKVDEALRKHLAAILHE